MLEETFVLRDDESRAQKLRNLVQGGSIVHVPRVRERDVQRLTVAIDDLNAARFPARVRKRNIERSRSRRKILARAQRERHDRYRNEPRAPGDRHTKRSHSAPSTTSVPGKLIP